MKLHFKNRLVVLLARLAVLYIVFMLCRVLFYVWNDKLIDPLKLTGTWNLLRGSLMFDTVSILYINLPFIFLSVFPLRIAEHRLWQKVTLFFFMLGNSLGLLINIADVFYYPFKQARIVLGDFVLLKEDSFGALLINFLIDFWYGLVFYIVLVAMLWYAYKAIQQKAFPAMSNKKYIPIHFGYMAVMAIAVIFFVRGATFSAASFPITMNDAFLYTDNPSHTSLMLSNPFCVLRTMSKSKKVPNLHYMDDAEAQKLAPTTHTVAAGDQFTLDRKTNVFLIVLESFGKAHIKSMSDQFKQGQQTNTPFIDSLVNESYVFTNAYQSGLRSIDALPAIWASIPSFKEHFLSLPNSVSSYHGLPQCMVEMGYETAFFHGGVRESMGFVSFGKTAGVKQFYSRQEYEAEMGTDDFDGKWGIWDHKFLPYVHQKLNGIKKPFFGTVFTLSSHHPYSIPPGYEKQFTEGTLPIHRTIKYADYSLKEFFKSIKNEPWYNNTLFIITADHGSGSDNDKFNKQPNEYAIPLIFFKPGDNTFKGKDDRVMQHIDIMPTLLGMLDYDKPYFAFGEDHFDKALAKDHFVVNFSNSAFNFTTDDYYYLFNEKEVIAKTDYHTDPLGKNNLIAKQTAADIINIKRFKAFLQEYYTHVNSRNYLPTNEQKKREGVK